MKEVGMLFLICVFSRSAFNQTVGSLDTSKAIIAEVLGSKITLKDKNNLRKLITKPLLEQFITDNKLEPTEQEIKLFLDRSKELQKQQVIKFKQEREKLLTELNDTSLSERDRSIKESSLQRNEKMLQSFTKVEKEQPPEMSIMELQVVQGFIKSWKVNKALYEKYGGRIVGQKFGPEPFDAIRDFLIEQEKAGAFKIIDKSCETYFWQYFANDKQRFMSKEDGEKYLNTPWWMMDPTNN